MRVTYSDAQWEYMMQFAHPAKLLALWPGATEAAMARIFGLTPAKLRRIHEGFTAGAACAAAKLLAESGFRALVRRLPFRKRATIVALGDSITDDWQSWAEILRHLAAMALPDRRLRIVNAGVSGETTTQIVSRFAGLVAEKPDWILCLAGTNDARRHGRAPTKTLVSAAETAKNLAMLANYAATETSARWVWMIPPLVVEPLIPRNWFLGPLGLSWRNRDLRRVAAAIRRRPEPHVDLQAAFGTRPDPALLLPDGLHPSLEGQKVIARALVRRLAGLGA